MNLTNRLCRLTYKIKEENDLKKIEKLWKQFFFIYLQSLGFNKESINHLFSWQIGDNWRDLHLGHSIYKNLTKEEILQRFKGEVEYVFDRLCFDRLFRTHWLICEYKRMK